MNVHQNMGQAAIRGAIAGNLALSLKALLICASMLTLVSSAQAGVINVDYDSDGTPHVGNDGVFSTTGTVWNSVSGDTTLVDESGVATGVSISGSAFGGGAVQAGVPELFSDTNFIDAGTGGGDRHDISGLSSDRQYDLAVYGYIGNQIGPQNIASAVVVTHAHGNSNSGNFGTPRGTAMLQGTEGREFVTFFGLTPYELGGGNYGFTITSGETGLGISALSGFQLRGDFAAVPEPSSMALLGLGATGIAVIARRRRSVSV